MDVGGEEGGRAAVGGGGRGDRRGAGRDAGGLARVRAAVDGLAVEHGSLSGDMWTQRVACEAHRVTKGYMNSLVMEYLVVEGRSRAAEAFAREAGVALPEGGGGGMAAREAARRLLLDGDVPAAVEAVEATGDGVLGGCPAVAFRLRLQQLVELVRGGRTEEALAWAGEQLVEFMEADVRAVQCASLLA